MTPSWFFKHQLMRIYAALVGLNYAHLAIVPLVSISTTLNYIQRSLSKNITDQNSTKNPQQIEENKKMLKANKVNKAKRVSYRLFALAPLHLFTLAFTPLIYYLEEHLVMNFLLACLIFFVFKVYRSKVRRGSIIKEQSSKGDINEPS